MVPPKDGFTWNGCLKGAFRVNVLWRSFVCICIISIVTVKFLLRKDLVDYLRRRFISLSILASSSGVE